MPSQNRKGLHRVLYNSVVSGRYSIRHTSLDMFNVASEYNFVMSSVFNVTEMRV